MTEGACISRMQRLEDLWNRSDHFELLSDEDVDSSDSYFTTNVFEQIEEAYLISLGLFQDFLCSLKASQTPASSNSQVGVGTESFQLNQAKLPQIVLPTFKGDSHEWVKFRDTFNEMVLKRTNLPNIYKMHHLRSSLSGEAAELLDEIPPAGENFESAWNTIKSFYDNPSLLISRLVNKLLAFNAMSSNTAHEITRIRTGVNNLLKALQALGSPVDSWDHITVTLTVSKLTTRLQAKWAETVAKRDDSDVHPTFEEFDKFLITERLSQTHLEGAKSSSTSLNQDGRNTSNRTRSKSVKMVHVVQESVSRSSSCAICKDEHLVQECSVFLAKSPADRKRLVMSKHIYFNCLGGHLIPSCKSKGRCRRCSGKHHTSLHIDFSKQNSAQSNTSSNSSNDVLKQTEVPATSNNITVVLNSNSENSARGRGPVLLATAWVYVHSVNGRVRAA